MWAHVAVSCSSSLCTWWANSIQWSRMKLTCPRSCAKLLTGCWGPARAHRQGTANSDHGPIREVSSAAVVLAPNSIGPYDSLVLSLIMHLVGQFNPIIQNEIGPSEGLWKIAYRLLRASLSASAKDSKFISWANPRGVLGSYSASFK